MRKEDYRHYNDMFDEIHWLTVDNYSVVDTSDLNERKKRLKKAAENTLITAYLNGMTAAVNMINDLFMQAGVQKYFSPSVSEKDADKAVYEKIAGKDFAQRLDEYSSEIGNDAEVERVLQTEAHRLFNTGLMDALILYELADYGDLKSTEDEEAKEANPLIPNLPKTAVKKPKLGKQWRTMEDERVRDTHTYLDGVKTAADERFYTYDGDSARFPGDFSTAQNNVNCRCWIDIVQM